MIISSLHYTFNLQLQLLFQSISFLIESFPISSFFILDPEPTQSQAQETPSGIKKLFEGLVSAGVLQTSLFNIESAPSPPPNIETSEDDIPNIGFVMEQLKTYELITAHS